VLAMKKHNGRRKSTMSQLLEILGKGLVGSLWSVLGRRLHGYRSDTRLLAIQLSERPEDANLLVKATVSYYRESLLEKAMDHARTAIRLNPNMIEGHLILACVLEKTGRRGEAAEVLEKLRIEDKKLAGDLRFAIGFLYETAKDYSKAATCYQQALKNIPNLINAYQRLAAMALREKKFDSAIEYYKEICRIEPEDVTYRTLLAGLYLNNNQPRKAVAEYQLAMTIEPDNWETENEMVHAYVKTGQYQSAIELLEQQLENEGEFPDLYLQLAELYAKIGDDAQAQKYFRDALEVHPGYLEAMVKFGTYHLKIERYLQAAEWFSRAIDTNDRLLNAYIGLAVAQEKMKQPEKSQETIELAMAIEPNTTMLFAEVARLELKASGANEGKDYLTSGSNHPQLAKELLAIQMERFACAIEAHPDRADWHYRYGLLLKSQGQVAAAAEEFTLAVEINPQFVKALVKLGLAENELGKKEEARQYLERGVMLASQEMDVPYQLGLIYADQARYRLAIDEFEETQRKNGQEVDALAAMGQALEDIGMKDQAKASWQSIIEIAPESEQAKLAKASLS
jgi:tetratricopeptide (TPR) repeat protein